MKLQRSFAFSIFAFVAITFIVIQVVTFLHYEQPIYVWDYKVYWSMWQEFAQHIGTSVFHWLDKLRASVKNNDYNALPISFLFPFYYLPLEKRTAYLLATSLCYLTSVTYFLFAIFNRLHANSSRLWLICVAVTALTFVPFWAPILRGFPDIVGLIPILAVTLFVLKTDLTQKITIKHFLILGVLLWLPFALRRWYAYSVVTLYLTLPLLSFFIHTRYSEKTLKKLMTIGYHFFFAGITSLVLVALFQKRVAMRILSTNYAEIYSAYQAGVDVSLATLKTQLGLYLLPFLILGIIGAFFGKRNNAKDFGLFCLANLIISFILFTKTQTPALQHLMPFALWILCLSLLGLHWLLELLQRPVLQKTLMSISMVFTIAICVVTFHKLSGQPVFVSALLPYKCYPFQVDNYTNYQKLATAIEQWIQNGERVAIIASATEFNDALIETITQDRISPYMLPQSHVDLRDGPQLSRFLTRYIVIGDPVQTHLSHGQNVVTIPVQEFISHTGLSAAYRRLPVEYELNSGVRAIVFEKVRPFTHLESKAFLAQFVTLYPEWEHIYLSPLALAYMSAQVTYGDSAQSRFIFDNNTVIAHPGATQSIEIEWDFGNISQLNFQSVDSGNENGVHIKIENDAGVQQNLTFANKETITADVSAFMHQRGRIIIEATQPEGHNTILITIAEAL